MYVVCVVLPGDSACAREWYHRALRLDPCNEEAGCALVDEMVRRGQPLRGEGPGHSESAAAALLERALAANPSERWANIRLARCRKVSVEWVGVALRVMSGGRIVPWGEGFDYSA